jgi:WbqC-like protein family
MGKRIAILQSNYIPWKGYFDLINSVDEFILYDTAQFTKNDWRNRNLIKTPDGLRWLTIPVVHRLGQNIQDTRIADPHWAKKHWRTLAQTYAHAAHFPGYRERLEDLFLHMEATHLSQVNHRLLTAICGILGITTHISWSRDYELIAGQTERLVSLCLQAGASTYLSGPAAKSYLREHLFAEAGIQLQYFDYFGYPLYRQLYGPFQHGVTILDLLFNEGPTAIKYMKSFGTTAVEALAMQQ